MPAEPSILVALGSQEGSPCSLQAAICFPTLVLFWPCCYLQFGFLLQTALPEGRLRRPGSARRSGRLACGRLPERPAICVWLALGCCHCSPRGPGWSHFLSVLAIAHVPCSAKWSSYQRRRKQQEEEGPGAQQPPFLLWGGTVVSHPSLPLIWGAYLSLCPCAGERTFLSEVLPDPRGN